MLHKTTTLMTALALLLVAGSATAGPMFSLETIIADGMFNNAPSMGIDDAGVLHVAYTAALGTNTTGKEVWYARRAPGQSWQFVQISDNSVREEFPCLQLDDAGNVHIAFHTGAGTTNKVRYTNNIGGKRGLFFNEPIDITAPGYVIAEIDVDSNGTVHFVFTSQNSQALPTDVFYTTWTQAGGVGALVNLSQSAGEYDSSPQLSIAPDDSVHIVWQRGDALGGPLKYVNNTSGSFQEQATGVGGVLESFIVVDDAGVVTIFYRPGFDSLNFIESAGNRGGFTTPQPVYTGNYRSAFIENVAVDINGNRYVAFASNTSPNRGTYLSRETDSGWLQPQFIDNGDLTNLRVSLGINDSGELAIVYCQSGFDEKVLANLKVAETVIDLGGCPADIAENDQLVNVFDLLELLSGWGTSGPGADIAEPTDVVDVFDLLDLLAAWGPCE